MKFYINTEGVICWNPKGWPESPEFKGDYFLHYGPQKQYEQALSRAKSESVPVRDQEQVHEAMGKHFLNGRKINPMALIWTKGAFYTVPDSEINKEWL